jgi:hypothetical protein
MHPQKHSESEVLDLWEQGVGLHRWRREEALLAASGTPPRGLGARNAALLGLRNTHFHGAWPMRSTCPGCGAEAEFAVDSAELAANLTSAAPGERQQFDWRGLTITARAPTVDDLRTAAKAGHPRDIARALLALCIEGTDLADWDDDAVGELGDRLESLDPGATLQFDLTCPDCAHVWPALVDVADAVWREVRGFAERLLLEVDALARVYGWTEQQVLALSPTRRAAYLQLAEAQ